MLRRQAAKRTNRRWRVSDWLFAETDGQPLFVAGKRFKALVADGLLHHNRGYRHAGESAGAKFATQSAGSRIVQGVQEIIKGWLARISDPARAIVAAVSVLSQQATFRHLCQVAGLDPELHAIDALDDLLGKQLLQEADSALALPHPDPIYSFSHQKASEVVYAEASVTPPAATGVRSRRLHLVATPAADLAYHALHAGCRPRPFAIASSPATRRWRTLPFAWPLRTTKERGRLSNKAGGRRNFPVQTGRPSTGLCGVSMRLTEAWPKAQQIYETMISLPRCWEPLRDRVPGAQSSGNGAPQWAERPGARVARYSGTSAAGGRTERRPARVGRNRMESLIGRNPCARCKLALHHSERAVAIAQELGHPHLLARCLTSTAQAYSFLRQWDKALPYVLRLTRCTSLTAIW